MAVADVNLDGGAVQGTVQVSVQVDELLRSSAEFLVPTLMVVGAISIVAMVISIGIKKIQKEETTAGTLIVGIGLAIGAGLIYLGQNYWPSITIPY